VDCPTISKPSASFAGRGERVIVPAPQRSSGRLVRDGLLERRRRRVRLQARLQKGVGAGFEHESVQRSSMVAAPASTRSARLAEAVLARKTTLSTTPRISGLRA
jgi:hypothetical protein